MENLELMNSFMSVRFHFFRIGQQAGQNFLPLDLVSLGAAINALSSTWRIAQVGSPGGDSIWAVNQLTLKNSLEILGMKSYPVI